MIANQFVSRVVTPLYSSHNTAIMEGESLLLPEFGAEIGLPSIIGLRAQRRRYRSLLSEGTRNHTLKAR